VGKLMFELDVVVRGARDVAGASRARAGLVDGLVHGIDHDRVLALAQVVVGAPDHHVALFAARHGPRGQREIAAMALQVGEDAVAALGADLLDGVPERSFVIHATYLRTAAGKTAPTAKRAVLRMNRDHLSS